MSLEIARQVDQQHPELLKQNVVSTCYQFVVYELERLRAEGHEAYHICKSPGEGQYTPPGFEPREVIGLDGKPYTCSGVSHDALWCDGLQFDTIGSGNDSAQPIYKDPVTGQATFEPIGPQIVGTPAWNAIPPEHWRPNNPPLMDGGTTPPPSSGMPSYEEMGGDQGGIEVTVLMEKDYKTAGKPGLDGKSGAWQWRTAYDFLAGNCESVEESIEKHQPEWRQSLNDERKSQGKPPITKW